MIGESGRVKGPGSFGTTKRRQTRPGQMVAYPAVHCHDERPEPSIGIPVTLAHNDRECSERRFEPMREIGDVTPGPFETESVLVEKRIEFGDKGRDFAWLRACYPLGSPSADALQFLSELR